MKVALDTNLLVRLLTNDDMAQAARVEAWLVANATPQLPAYVDHVVLCELGWVLERSYAYSRKHVHEAIAALLEYDFSASSRPRRCGRHCSGLPMARPTFRTTCSLLGHEAQVVRPC
jgi:predicted nucleic acid-binding protein